MRPTPIEPHFLNGVAGGTQRPHQHISTFGSRLFCVLHIPSHYYILASKWLTYILYMLYSQCLCVCVCVILSQYHFTLNVYGNLRSSRRIRIRQTETWIRETGGSPEARILLFVWSWLWLLQNIECSNMWIEFESN